MTLILLYLVVLILVATVLFGVGSVLFGRGERLPPLPRGTTATVLPASGVTGADVEALKFAQSLRGYKASEVDWVLDRLAQELDLVRGELAAVRAAHAADPDRLDGAAARDGSDRAGVAVNDAAGNDAAGNDAAGNDAADDGADGAAGGGKVAEVGEAAAAVDARPAGGGVHARADEAASER